MRILRSVTEQEMVANFLRAEISSSRWQGTILALLQQHNLDRGVVEEPDLEDAAENAARARILGDFRGYGQERELFQHFPPLGTVVWNRAVLNRDDLAGVRYIDYSYWNELSGGTRLASVAAENIRRGVTVFGVSNRNFWSAAGARENGVHFPELILVRSETTPLVVLEGHLRLTAYFLAPEHTRAEIIAFVGTAPEFARW